MVCSTVSLALALVLPAFSLALPALRMAPAKCPLEDRHVNVETFRGVDHHSKLYNLTFIRPGICWTSFCSLRQRMTANKRVKITQTASFIGFTRRVLKRQLRQGHLKRVVGQGTQLRTSLHSASYTASAPGRSVNRQKHAL